MAKKDGLKSVGEARTLPRPRRLAARVPVVAVAAVPEPRDLNGGKPDEEPTAFGELLGQKAHGDKATNQPFTYYTFHAHDEPVQTSAQGRTRRCYEAKEKLQVADTRRRGACNACRAKKKKCHHDPSEIATEKYRVQFQSQSHELFALGLTTDSETANEDEHKQVMEEKIAALDDKLVKAQSGENNEANGDLSPPDVVTTTKGPNSQLQNHPVEVHHASARPKMPIPLKQGMCMNVFKLNESGARKPTRKGQANKGISKAATDVASGRNRRNACRPPTTPQPIVLQKNPAEDAVSTPALNRPYDKNLTAWRPDRQEGIYACSSTAKINTQIGCKSFQHPSKVHLEPPNPISSQINSGLLRPREKSKKSERDTQTMATDESMLSLDRSTTPFSEPSVSDHPSYVHPADLERSKSYDLVLSEDQIVLLPKPLAHRQTSTGKIESDGREERLFSYESLLYSDWDSDTLISNSTGTEFTASQTGSMSFNAITSNAPLPESKYINFPEPMEIDT